MTRKRALALGIVAASLLLTIGAIHRSLETRSRENVPSWWREPEFWPYGSGSVRWRVEALRLKLLGQLPELSLGEVVTKVFERQIDPIDSGFVTTSSRDGVDPCPQRFDTAVGPVWGRMMDENLLEFLVVEQLIDRVYEHGAVALEEGDVVLDVGSHLGMFTRHALMRGAAKVVAIEPEPINIACFRKTFANEIRDGRVVLVEAAAWHSPATLDFGMRSITNTGAGKVTEDGNLEVEALPIDTIVSDLGLERLDFIKMDIEGAERHALAGAQETLRRFAPRIALCTYHLPDDPEALRSAVLGARPKYQVAEVEHFIYFH